jgi:hypothetical protein
MSLTPATSACGLASLVLTDATTRCRTVWQGSELQVKADCDQANWEAEREENNRD